ncbi:MAG TPA: ethanolamine ammonia-lyase reactivating factor EutA [Micromonosporaceae bacterium]|nr:ethanolamine ammonia-lyase reactivating factor EutA [Micromonosporaceae bacterium]
MSNERAPGPSWLGGSDVESVQLTTVGIDVGSTTTHAVFGRVRLRRQAQALSSRYAVVERVTLARTPVALTPYRSDGLIDADRVQALMRQGYVAAGLRPDTVDSGAVILTGSALQRPNARALTERLAGAGGRLVCASAGHHLEATLAAHGSGAVAYSSRLDGVLLHIDIGGGTSKLSLVRRGEIIATAAVRVGGRLVAFDDAGMVTRIEPAAARVAGELGVQLRCGAPVGAADREAIARLFAQLLVEVAAGGAVGPLATELLVTEPLPALAGTAVRTTLSGGVAEYIAGRCRQRFGDLGPELAEAVRAELGRRLPPDGHPVGELIRATVIGAAEFTVQLSGSTVHISDASVLPLRNVPVARPALGRLVPPAGPDTGGVADAIRQALQRVDGQDPARPVAIALPRLPGPGYPVLRRVAEALVAAVPGGTTGRAAVVLAVDGDLGLSLGRILAEEVGLRGAVVALDELQLRELDFVDVGTVLQPAGVVPVVVKSLLFERPAGRQDPTESHP